ncbi:MAG: ATP-binding protein [Halobacteriales archaeon]
MDEIDAAAEGIDVEDGAGESTGSDGLRHLIEHIGDAVVEFELVEGEPIVRGVNRSFVEVFGYGRAEIVDAPLNEFIVPEWLSGEARALDERTASGEVNYRRVRRETADGLREFLYRGVPYDEAGDRTDGFAVYTDLTEVTRTERRLQVLNRILRHNLRNTVNSITGNTTLLLEELDGESEGAALTETIESSARDLETLVEEATAIQRTLNADPSEEQTVDCVPLIRDAVETFREAYPDATIGADLPDRTVVRATDRLQVAVEALIENAIVHNPAAEPTVDVRVEPVGSGGWVDIVVADDAPAIPAAEREVVTGEAEITPTRHGSGLGLWLVKWTVENSGGEVAFETSELGGNAVRLRLPR